MERNSDNFQPKSLFKLPDMAMIAGVAAGLAVHLDLPVKVVRAAFVLLFLISRGAWGIVYLILMVTMPTARTEEDFGRARGQVRV